MVRNRGVIFALVFAIAVIIFALMNGGIKHDEPENAVYCSTDSDDLRADERQKVKEEDDEEAVVAITNIGIVYEPDPYEETEEILYSEVLNEERTSGETDDYHDPDSDAVTDEWSDIWTPEADNAAVEPVDVWDMGLEWYGISYEDTTRTLKLITYEGYGWSDLSYYVACACWVRATEGYWGYGNLYSAFGEVDTQYGLWMDELGYADYAIAYLEMCYQNPTYCKYVNGLVVPSEYIYREWAGGCWIYVWN